MSEQNAGNTNTRAPSVGAGDYVRLSGVPRSNFRAAVIRRIREMGHAGESAEMASLWIMDDLDKLASAPTAPGREPIEGEPSLPDHVVQAYAALHRIAQDRSPTDAGMIATCIGRLSFHAGVDITQVPPALSPSSAHPSQGLVKALEDLREMMLRQPISEHGRETYSDGFAQGLCEAIGKIDAAQGKDDGRSRNPTMKFADQLSILIEEAEKDTHIDEIYGELQNACEQIELCSEDLDPALIPSTHSREG